MNLTEYMLTVGPLFVLFIYASNRLIDENKITNYPYVNSIIVGNMIGVTLAVGYYLIKCGG